MLEEDMEGGSHVLWVTRPSEKSIQYRYCTYFAIAAADQKPL